MLHIDTSKTSWTVFRILAALYVLPATIFVARGIYALVALNNELDIFSIGMLGGASLLAILGWWFAIRGGDRVSCLRLLHALIGGVILGAICFAIGFFGPMITSPESNQGPLAGILITGPIGFVIGVVCGAIVGLIRVPREHSVQLPTKR